MTNLPTHPDLPDLTWVIPGELAAMGRPGSIVGFEQEMKALLAVGIRRIISLTERPIGVGMGPLTDFQIYHSRGGLPRAEPGDNRTFHYPDR
ncbi:hypothetical protein K8R78_04550 [bacterium]|nr:hypothetical protein [bacterium]